MREGGTHTYDLFLEYLSCPACHKIFEERHDYENRLGKWMKEVLCPHCGKTFLVEKTFLERRRGERRVHR